MKKLALFTTALALMPAAAFANDYHGDKANKSNWDKQTRNMKHDADNADVVVRVKSAASMTSAMNANKTYNLADNSGRIHVENGKIFVVSANGNSYYAPRGAYTTDSGLTYYSNDGVIAYVEGPAEMVAVDTDFYDTNRNGYTDDVDVDVTTRKARY